LLNGKSPSGESESKVSESEALNKLSLTSAASIPTVASTELMQGGKTLIIRHQGADYRLQVTRSQKLILTK
jgi:hemin uptake protein HemP